MEKSQNFNLKTVLYFLGLLLLFYAVKSLDYLFFHSVVEIFGVLVSGAIFIIVYNTKSYFDNKYFIYVAFGYLFMSAIDILHLMSFGDANIIKGNDNIPTQLWIVARYLQAFTLITAPFVLGKKIRYSTMFIFLSGITGASLLSIFLWKNFPACYVEGVGLTSFKIISEYAVSLVFLLSIFLLYRKKEYFHSTVFEMLLLSISIAIISEVAFTLYMDVTGTFNFLGHCFKIISFYYFYKASIEIGLKDPYSVMFSELALREKRYKAIVQDQSEMIMLRKPDRIITFLNKAYCDYYGFEIDDVLGKRHFPEINEADKKILEKNIKELDQKNPVTVNEIRVRHKGEERWQRWTNRAIFDDNNNIVEYLSVGMDITEKKAAEQKLAWLASFAEVSPNPIVELDMSGNIKYINQSAKKNFPELEEVKHNHPFLWEWNAVADIFREGKEGSFGREIIVGNKWYYQDIYYIPQSHCVRIYGRDITERKIAEDYTKKSYADMEEMVKERTRKLAEANEKLMMNKRLSDIGELSAIVAHELRNPLAAMRIAAYNIKRKAKSGIFDRNIENIEKKIIESNQIINNLLFYSRIKGPQFEAVDLILVIKDCLGLAVKRYTKKKVKVVKKFNKMGHLEIAADPVQMKELFMNIVNNACEAMRDGMGKLEVSVNIEAGNVIVKIKDNGTGISGENLKRISEPFFTTKAKGTGLGLTVCFQIVKLHEGLLNYLSDENIGTTAEVKLPIRKYEKENDTNN